MVADAQAGDLAGLVILVVEDEYLIAAELTQVLTDARASVLGPAASEARARAILRQTPMVDGVVLDIDLGGRQAWSLVDELVEAGVTVVLASGYSAEMIPERHHRLPRSGKPVELQTIAQALRHRMARR